MRPAWQVRIIATIRMEFSGMIHSHVSIMSVLGTIFLMALLSFLFKLYKARSVMLELRRQGLVC